MLAPAFGLGEVEMAYGIVEWVFCLFIQVALVALEGEDVVGLLLDNGLGKGNSAIRCPSTDYVTCFAVKSTAAAQSFAIDGNELL